MGLILTQPPAEEPITLARAKQHLRVDQTHEDALIDALIVAAREQAEAQTGRALVTQQWRLTLDEFPAGDILLPRPPLVSVQSIAYRDSAGDMQPFANFSAFTSGILGRIAPVWSTNWPSVRRDPEAVVIDYTAGYGNANAVPESIKIWMLLTLGTLYENRQTVLPGQFAELPRAAWDGLLDPYRVVNIV